MIKLISGVVFKFSLLIPVISYVVDRSLSPIVKNGLTFKAVRGYWGGCGVGSA